MITPALTCPATSSGAAPGRDLDPLAARRPHLELYIRWMQEVRRFRPSTVSQQFLSPLGSTGPASSAASLSTRPPGTSAVPACQPGHPRSRFAHLQFEALLTAAAGPRWTAMPRPGGYDSLPHAEISALRRRRWQLSDARLLPPATGAASLSRRLRKRGRGRWQPGEPKAGSVAGRAETFPAGHRRRAR